MRGFTRDNEPSRDEEALRNASDGDSAESTVVQPAAAGPTAEPVEDAASTEPAPEPTATDRAWNEALRKFIDEQLRSTPVAQHPPGWGHLMGVLPKLREYVEKELNK